MHPFYSVKIKKTDMKKIIIATLVIAALAVACSPKIAPTNSSSSSELIPLVPGNDANDIAVGQTIFTTSCTKCHREKIKYVSTHTYTEAIPVVTKMAGKAKLTQEQAKKLAAYVYSVSKK